MAYDKIIDTEKFEMALASTAGAIRKLTNDDELIEWKKETGFTEALETVFPDELFTLTDKCNFSFTPALMNKMYEIYPERFKTENITDLSNMYYNSKIASCPIFTYNISGPAVKTNKMFCNTVFEEIPTLNFEYVTDDSFIDTTQMIYVSDVEEVSKIKSIGTISNLRVRYTNQMFVNCYNLRDIGTFTDVDFTRMHNLTSLDSNLGTHSMFRNCHSLRSIPKEFLRQIKTPNITDASLAEYSHPYYMFFGCHSLDEVVGISPLNGTCNGTNILHETFDYCGRLKNVIFDTQKDNIPYSVNWKGQVLDLSMRIGYMSEAAEQKIMNANSGITLDKKVIDDASYQALKDDPDWYTLDIKYSRYNHDSAVATINSLPDTSAYLAENGGTNGIKFKGSSGMSTNGGAINTLTEAEIAVATAKGWTVAFT